MLYCLLMRSVRFHTMARTVTWVLFAWVAVDLGVPSVCALDQEGQSTPSWATNVDISTDNGLPDQPVHIDDCFCCSHCVNVTAVSLLVMTPWADTDVSLPPADTPFPSSYPPYHPPKI